MIPEFSAFRAFLRSLNLDAAKVFLSETHRSIKQVIDRLPRGEPLRIVNVDFHHDYYHYYTGKTTATAATGCAGWWKSGPLRR